MTEYAISSTSRHECECKKPWWGGIGACWCPCHEVKKEHVVRFGGLRRIWNCWRLKYAADGDVWVEAYQTRKGHTVVLAVGRFSIDGEPRRMRWYNTLLEQVR